MRLTSVDLPDPDGPTIAFCAEQVRRYA